MSDIGSRTPWGAGAAAPRGLQEDQEGRAPEFAGRAPRWATGGQGGGVANGWNTDFYDTMFKQQEEELEKGSLGSWYSRKDYTGVATWDGSKDAAGRTIQFGDVYEGGVYRGNLLDEKSGYDKANGYQILAQILDIDPEAERRAYQGLRDNPKSVEELVEEVRKAANKQIEAQATQGQFADAVQQKKDEAGDGDNVGVIVAGAAASAAVGAGVGSIFGPAGTLLGGAGGAIVGGFTSWLNQDQLTDQAARAAVQTDMAQEQFGEAGAASTFLKNWGGVAVSALSPTSNLVQGLTDVDQGTLGDDRAEYYAMEDRPGWLTAIGLGAGFLDALAQFSNPIGATAYLAATGATVAGGVGQLSTQGGATFDDRTGTFDSPDDVGQWAAAIGAVGIDAIQMGGAGGIYRAAARLGGPQARLGDGLLAKLDRYGNSQALAGRRFQLDANGNAVSSRISATFLAPSEMVQWATVTASALRRKTHDGALTADDLYQAAIALQSGTRPIKQALVNGFGEGAEEAAQAALEPASHGWSPTMEDIAAAAATGFVMGAGMTVGSSLGRSGRDSRALDKANAAQLALDPSFTPLTMDEWSQLSEAEKKAAQVVPELLDRTLSKAAKIQAEAQKRQVVKFAIAADRSNDALRAMAAKEAGGLNDSLDRILRIALHESADVPPRAVLSTASTFATNLDRHRQGLQEAMNASEPGSPEREELARVLAAAQALDQRIAPILERTIAAASFQERAQAVTELNGLIEAAWNSSDLDVARSVSLAFTRDPQDNGGSLQVLLPQVSIQLNEYGVGGDVRADGVIQIGSGILPSTTADFDGDNFRLRARLVLDPAAFVRGRTGATLLGVDGVNIVPTAFEEQQIRSLGLAMADENSVNHLNAASELDQLRAGLLADLGSYPGIEGLVDGLISNLAAGVPDARIQFSQLLATLDPDAIREISEKGTPNKPGLTDPWLEIVGQRVLTAVQRYSSQAAPRQSVELNVDVPVSGVAIDGNDFQPVSAKQAATAGQTMLVIGQQVDAMRAYQALHYTARRSTTDSAGRRKDDATIREQLVEFYAELSSSSSTSALEDLFAKDEVIAEANRMLDVVAQAYQVKARPRALAREAVAGLLIPNIDREGNDYGGVITIAQAVLREAAAKFKRRDQSILEADPQLALKYRVYSSMDAYEAIGELQSSTPVVQLLGEAAHNLGNSTMEQAKRLYLKLDPEQRSVWRETLKSDARYDRSKHHDLPYSWEELQSGEISSYQVTVDALLGWADKELSLDRESGEVSGRNADQDTALLEGVEGAMDNLGKGLRTFEALYADSLSRRDKRSIARDPAARAQRIASILDNNPEAGRALLNALPDDVANVIVQRMPDGTVALPNWFFEMLSTGDPKRSAMIFLRQSFLARLADYDAQQSPDAPEDTLVQLFVELRQDPGGIEAADFLELLLSSRDVREWRAAVNRKFAFDRAPILAFYRDVAAFDPASTKGGWSMAQPGALHRKALRELSTRAASFQAHAVQETALFKQDSALIVEIQQDPKHPMRRVIQQRLNEARAMNPGIGPAEMFRAAFAAVNSFSGSLTDKGKAGDAYAPFGHSSARGTTRTWGHGPKKLLDSLLTGSTEDAARNPGSLSVAQRLMDPEGRLVEWDEVTVDSLLEGWRDPSMVGVYRAVLFPSVWTSPAQNDGQVQQFLTGQSLKDFLESEPYKRMLRSGESVSEAMKYVSMVDGINGDYLLYRQVQNLAIARTSAARRTMTPEQMEESVAQAFIDIAQIYRTAANTDPLALRKDLEPVFQMLSSQTAALGTDLGLQNQLQRLVVKPFDDRVQELEQAGATREEIDAAIAQADAVLGLFTKGYNEVGEIVRFYSLDWTSPDAEAKADAFYAELMQLQDIPSVVTGKDGIKAAEIIGTALSTGANRPRLSASESVDREYWEAAGRALAQAKLDEVSAARIAGVPSAGIPSGKAAKHSKFWDSTYSFLVSPIFSEDSPELRSARKFREIALGEVAFQAAPSALSREIFGRVFRKDSLGPWNPYMAVALVEGQNRIDSSGAGDQVAAAGISYEEEDALSGATRRTTLDPALAGQLTVRKYQLDRATLESGAAEVDDAAMVDEQGRPESTLLLNGRFYQEATITIRRASGTETVSLSSGRLKAGFHSRVSESTRRSELKVTSLERLRRAAQDLAGDAEYSIEISVLHPDDLPAGREWANNVFYEGTVFENDGDDYDSLNGAAYFGPGGINQSEQRQALDAVKSALQAIRAPEIVEQGEVRAMEDVLDLSATLRRKTNAFFSRSTGHGLMPRSLAPAIAKAIKSHHAIRGTTTDSAGNVVPVLLSAEEVLRHQAANPGTLPGDLQNAEIVVLATANLNAILGDDDSRGLNRPLTGAPSIDTPTVGAWRGTFDQALVRERQPGLLEFTDGAWARGDVVDTAIARRPHASQLTVVPMLTGKAKSLFTQRERLLGSRAESINRARIDNRSGVGTDIREWSKRNADRLKLDAEFRSTVPELSAAELGLPDAVAFAKASAASQELADMAVNSQLDKVRKFQGFRAFWQYTHDRSIEGDRTTGVLRGIENLEDQRKKNGVSLNISPSDVVIVDASTFLASTDPAGEMEKVLTKLSGLGVTIVLTAGESAATDAIFEAGAALETQLGYARVPGSRSTFVEANRSEQYQTIEAHVSRLGETDLKSTLDHILAFQTDDVPGAFENTALINTAADRNGREILAVRDLVPTTAYGFAGPAQDPSQAAVMRERLQAALDNPGLLRHLTRQTTGQYRVSGEQIAEFTEALSRALENMDAGTGLPKVGSTLRPGDIIPLTNPRGEMILYRHGTKPFDNDAALQAQLSQPLDGDPSGRAGGWAVYRNDLLPAATTHSLVIREWRNTSGYGLSVIGGIPLSEYGDKSVFERTGFKTTGVPGEQWFPSNDVVAGWGIREMIGLSDSISKQNEDGVVNNARDAIAVFGADFTGPIARTLFNMTAADWDALTDAEKGLYRSRVTDLLSSIARTERQSLSTVNELIRMSTEQQSRASTVVNQLLGSELLGAYGLPVNVAQVLSGDQLDPEVAITRAAMLYMLAPGARPNHILSSRGIAEQGQTGVPVTTRMPRVFTNIFDRAPAGSPLRSFLIDGINRNIANTSTSEGYAMLPTYEFQIKKQGNPTLTGRLQFVEIHSSGDNVVMQEQADSRKAREGASSQYAKIANQAFNLSSRQAAKLPRTDAAVRREGLADISEPKDLYALMRGPQRKGEKSPARLSPTRALTRAEREYRRAARIGYQAFRQRIDTTLWETDAERIEYAERTTRLLNRLGVSGEYAGMVDGWVRQWLAKPKDKNPTTPGGEGRVYYQQAIEALDQIELNLEAGALPVHQAAVPLISRNDLWLLFNAGTWRPVTDRTAARAETWEEWVDVAFGSAKASEMQSWLLTPTDGFLHTYADSDNALRGLPTSVDQLKQLQLLDASTNEMIVSLDPTTSQLLREMPIYDARTATYEDIFGGQVHDGKYAGKYPPKSAMARRLGSISRWKAEGDMQEQISQSLGEVRHTGFRYRHDGTTTNALMRSLVSLRAAQGMMNPLLWISAPVEAFFRSTLENAQGYLTGDSTSSLVSGWSPYSDATRASAQAAQQDLSGNAGFRGMLYHDLFQHPKLQDANWIERKLDSVARVSAKWQDPTRGIRQETLSRIYVTTIMTYYSQLGDSTVTPERAIAELRQNPMSFRNNHPDAHRMALNKIADLRSMKQTTASVLFGGSVDALAANRRYSVNVLSHLALKIPFLFQNYAFNFATNILGLQGADAIMSVLLTNRTTGKSGGRVQAFLRGEQYDPAVHGFDLLGEVQTSIDFSDAFIKGGLSHTALMGLGLMVGQLGLTGEDEEDRRLRRMASVQGGVLMDDPRTLEQDFRNADTVYFDNILFLEEYFRVGEAGGETTSPAVMHWTVKQFVSPFLGIAKFIDTGDYRQVLWGFEDAVEAMPLINTMYWDDASRTAAELYAASLDSEARGTPEDLASSANLLINSVMRLERMLFENSFINSLYTTMDKYDRDPWVLPEVDGDGRLVRNDLGQPAETSALQQTFNDDGTIREEYVGRTWDEATLRQLGENRATLALFYSLFTGSIGTQQSLLRSDQAIKERTIERQALETEDAAALVLSMWDPENERETLTREGGAAVLRGLMAGTVRPGDPALQNVFLTFEQREEIQEDLMGDILLEGLELGLTQDEAVDRVRQYWWGSDSNPSAIPLNEVVWSQGRFKDAIPWNPTVTYNQLNTTYVVGPDGFPMATGVERGKLENFFGQGAFRRFEAAAGNLQLDNRLNSADPFNQLNTGMRSLELVDDSWTNPTEDDILEAMKKGFEDVIDAIRQPGWGNDPYGGGRGFGGGGGGGYSYRINAPDRNNPTYGRNIPYIRVDNVILRRAMIRRERFSAERGRLKQWQ